jgi:hypothetical protein
MNRIRSPQLQSGLILARYLIPGVENCNILKLAGEEKIFVVAAALNQAAPHAVLESFLMLGAWSSRLQQALYRYLGMRDKKKTVNFSSSLKMAVQFLKYMKSCSLLARTRSPSIWYSPVVNLRIGRSPPFLRPGHKSDIVETMNDHTVILRQLLDSLRHIGCHVLACCHVRPPASCRHRNHLNTLLARASLSRMEWLPPMTNIFLAFLSSLTSLSQLGSGSGSGYYD